MLRILEEKPFENAQIYFREPLEWPIFQMSVFVTCLARATHPQVVKLINES